MGITYEELKKLKGNSVVLERQENIEIEKTSDSYIRRKHTIIRERFPREERAKTIYKESKKKAKESKKSEQEVQQKFREQHFNDWEHKFRNLKQKQNFSKMRKSKIKKPTNSGVQNEDITWSENFKANNDKVKENKQEEKKEVTVEKYSQQYQGVSISPRYTDNEDIAVGPKMRTIASQIDNPKIGNDRGAFGDYSFTNEPNFKQKSNKDISNKIEDPLPTILDPKAIIVNCCHGICYNVGRNAICQRCNMFRHCNHVLCNRKNYRKSGETTQSEYNYCQEEYYYDNNKNSPQINVKRHCTDLNTQHFYFQTHDKSTSPKSRSICESNRNNDDLNQKYEKSLKTNSTKEQKETVHKVIIPKEACKEKIKRREDLENEKHTKEHIKSRELRKSRVHKDKSKSRTSEVKNGNIFYITLQNTDEIGKLFQNIEKPQMDESSTATASTFQVRNKEKSKTPPNYDIDLADYYDEEEYSLATLNMLKRMKIREYKSCPPSQKMQGNPKESLKQRNNKIKNKKYEEYVNLYRKYAKEHSEQEIKHLKEQLQNYQKEVQSLDNQLETVINQAELTKNETLENLAQNFRNQTPTFENEPQALADPQQRFKDQTQNSEDNKDQAKIASNPQTFSISSQPNRNYQKTIRGQLQAQPTSQQQPVNINDHDKNNLNLEPQNSRDHNTFLMQKSFKESEGKKDQAKIESNPQTNRALPQPPTNHQQTFRGELQAMELQPQILQDQLDLQKSKLKAEFFEQPQISTTTTSSGDQLTSKQQTSRGQTQFPRPKYNPETSSSQFSSIQPILQQQSETTRDLENSLKFETPNSRDHDQFVMEEPRYKTKNSQATYNTPSSRNPSRIPKNEAHASTKPLGLRAEPFLTSTGQINVSKDQPPTSRYQGNVDDIKVDNRYVNEKYEYGPAGGFAGNNYDHKVQIDFNSCRQLEREKYEKEIMDPKVVGGIGNKGIENYESENKQDLDRSEFLSPRARDNDNRNKVYEGQKEYENKVKVYKNGSNSNTEGARDPAQCYNKQAKGTVKSQRQAEYKLDVRDWDNGIRSKTFANPKEFQNQSERELRADLRGPPNVNYLEYNSRSCRQNSAEDERYYDTRLGSCGYAKERHIQYRTDSDKVYDETVEFRYRNERVPRDGNNKDFSQTTVILRTGPRHQQASGYDEVKRSQCKTNSEETQTPKYYGDYNPRRQTENQRYDTRIKESFYDNQKQYDIRRERERGSNRDYDKAKEPTTKYEREYIKDLKNDSCYQTTSNLEKGSEYHEPIDYDEPKNLYDYKKSCQIEDDQDYDTDTEFSEIKEAKYTEDKRLKSRRNRKYQSEIYKDYNRTKSNERSRKSKDNDKQMARDYNGDWEYIHRDQKPLYFSKNVKEGIAYKVDEELYRINDSCNQTTSNLEKGPEYHETIDYDEPKNRYDYKKPCQIEDNQDNDTDTEFSEIKEAKHTEDKSLKSRRNKKYQSEIYKDYNRTESNERSRKSKDHNKQMARDYNGGWDHTHRDQKPSYFSKNVKEGIAYKVDEELYRTKRAQSNKSKYKEEVEEENREINKNFLQEPTRIFGNHREQQMGDDRIHRDQKPLFSKNVIEGKQEQIVYNLDEVLNRTKRLQPNKSKYKKEEEEENREINKNFLKESQRPSLDHERSQYSTQIEDETPDESKLNSSYEELKQAINLNSGFPTDRSSQSETISKRKAQNQESSNTFTKTQDSTRAEQNRKVDVAHSSKYELSSPASQGEYFKNKHKPTQDRDLLMDQLTSLKPKQLKEKLNVSASQVANSDLSSPASQGEYFKNKHKHSQYRDLSKDQLASFKPKHLKENLNISSSDQNLEVKTIPQQTRLLVSQINQEIITDEAFGLPQKPTNTEDVFGHIKNLLTSFQNYGLEEECLNQVSTITNELLKKLSSCTATNQFQNSKTCDGNERSPKVKHPENQPLKVKSQDIGKTQINNSQSISNDSRENVLHLENQGKPSARSLKEDPSTERKPDSSAEKQSLSSFRNYVVEEECLNQVSTITNEFLKKSRNQSVNSKTCDGNERSSKAKHPESQPLKVKSQDLGKTQINNSQSLSNDSCEDVLHLENQDKPSATSLKEDPSTESKPDISAEKQSLSSFRNYGVEEECLNQVSTITNEFFKKSRNQSVNSKTYNGNERSSKAKHPESQPLKVKSQDLGKTQINNSQSLSNDSCEDVLHLENQDKPSATSLKEDPSTESKPDISAEKQSLCSFRNYGVEEECLNQVSTITNEFFKKSRNQSVNSKTYNGNERSPRNERSSKSQPLKVKSQDLGKTEINRSQSISNDSREASLEDRTTKRKPGISAEKQSLKETFTVNLDEKTSAETQITATQSETSVKTFSTAFIGKETDYAEELTFETHNSTQSIKDQMTNATNLLEKDETVIQNISKSSEATKRETYSRKTKDDFSTVKPNTEEKSASANSSNVIIDNYRYEDELKFYHYQNQIQPQNFSATENYKRNFEYQENMPDFSENNDYKKRLQSPFALEYPTFQVAKKSQYYNPNQCQESEMAYHTTDDEEYYCSPDGSERNYNPLPSLSASSQKSSARFTKDSICVAEEPLLLKSILKSCRLNETYESETYRTTSSLSFGQEDGINMQRGSARTFTIGQEKMSKLSNKNRDTKNSSLSKTETDLRENVYQHTCTNAVTKYSQSTDRFSEQNVPSFTHCPCMMGTYLDMLKIYYNK